MAASTSFELFGDLDSCHKATAASINDVECLLDACEEGGTSEELRKAGDGIAGISKLINDLDSLLFQARICCEEEDIPRIARELASKVDQKKEQVAQAKLQARKLVARAAQLKNRMQEQERETLFESRNGSSKVDKQVVQAVTKQAAMLDRSQDVASSLRRTMQRVSVELSRMSEAQQILSADSKTIDGTLQKHSSYRSAAVDNEVHLKQISRQEKIDEAILVVCIIIFVLVVLYIIWKRTFGWLI